jgi:GT2 family glycosyltransferase
MVRTLVGIVTFGNLEFTKLTIRSIRESAKFWSVDFFVVVGKPGDVETVKWLEEEATKYGDIAYKCHSANRGFPVSINDIYDQAWVPHADFDQVIIAGNDVVPYPGAIDAMIDCAVETDFEWIAASQFDARSLINSYPEQAKYFSGPTLVFTDFAARPWDVHAAAVAATPANIETNPNGPSLIKDVRNLCLFKKSVFDKIGYADVNFFPGGYFEDNDYARRAVNAGIKSCALSHSQYFHFWSRTIYQSDAGDRPPVAGVAKSRDQYFQANERFYHTKSI